MVPSPQDIAKQIAARAKAASPFLVGVGGGVASGKSTFAAELAAALAAEGVQTQVISLDGYLKTNAALQAAGLAHRKGFPETFDFARLLADVERMRAGEAVSALRYDHAANDVIDDGTAIAPGGVLILEGVIALSPELAPRLDFRIFLETDLEVARARYEARAHRVASEDPSHPLNTIPVEQRTSVLNTVWVEVNLRNYSEHIARTKDAADVLVTSSGSI